MGTRKKIELGDIAKDPVTGIQGVVVALTKWLHGCVRFTLQPLGKKKKDGVPHENHSFDEPQLVLVKKAFLKETHDTGGPRPEPRRRREPPR